MRTGHLRVDLTPVGTPAEREAMPPPSLPHWIQITAVDSVLAEVENASGMFAFPASAGRFMATGLATVQLHRKAPDGPGSVGLKVLRQFLPGDDSSQVKATHTYTHTQTSFCLNR